MRTISIHQPAYFPWLGYFDKIIKSDIFVYLDTVQFEKNSFINRNKIRTIDGKTIWLTIPLLMKGHTDKVIKEMKIDNTQNWKKKHIKSIEQNYKKTPFFDEYFIDIRDIISTAKENFTIFTFNMLEYLLGIFEIKTKIIKASDYNVGSAKSELVLDICRLFKADTYISGILGKNYLNVDEFIKSGIKVIFQNYEHPRYIQTGTDFLPNLSIIDLLFNLGEVEGRNLLLQTAEKTYK
jgi:hypothetical protein